MELLTKPQVMVFDWDNTLAENRDVVVSAMNKVLAKYGKDDWETIKKEKRDITKSLKDNFVNFFGDELAGTAYGDYLTFYREFNNLLKAPANAHNLLSFLNETGLKAIVVSNKERALLLEEMAVLYSDIDFYKIMAGGEAAENKPSAAPVFKALEDSNVEINPNNVWIIGDSNLDIECAYNANCQPILYGKGKLADAQYFEEKRKATPAMISIDNFQEIIDFLKK